MRCGLGLRDGCGLDWLDGSCGGEIGGSDLCDGLRAFVIVIALIKILGTVAKVERKIVTE